MIRFEYISSKKPSFLNLNKLKLSIKEFIKQENKIIGDITIIFTNDEQILDVNKKYLNHDYFTDIITFDYSEENTISGDLFISLDTVLSNSVLNNVTYKNELLRVIIHGILHLCSYNDKTKSEIKIIRSKEDFYLNTCFISL